MPVDILAVVSFSQLLFFSPSVSLLQQYTAVSQFWNTLVKAGSLLTVWQLRFSWASNKEQVIVPRITQWEYCSFLADNNAIHTVDPWLDNILIDHCHLSGNCLSAPIYKSLTQWGSLVYMFILMLCDCGAITCCLGAVLKSLPCIPVFEIFVNLCGDFHFKTTSQCMSRRQWCCGLR